MSGDTHVLITFCWAPLPGRRSVVTLVGAAVCQAHAVIAVIAAVACCIVCTAAKHRSCSTDFSERYIHPYKRKTNKM